MGLFCCLLTTCPAWGDRSPQGQKGAHMTLENAQELEDVQKPAEAEAQESKTDWKAEARKWEARAKKSADAEAELAALKASQMTEAEKAAAHLAEVESELATLKAEQQRRTDATEVAKATGVPVSLLEYCADRDAMEAFAAEYAEAKKASPAPTAERTRIVRNDGAKLTGRDAFLEYMNDRQRS